MKVLHICLALPTLYVKYIFITLLNTMVSSVLLGVGRDCGHRCLHNALGSIHPSWATRVLRALVLPALLPLLSVTDFGLPCTW